ncbi:hypothetical protein KPP03845_104310 [Streptomyces xanthophaeus]|uniref:hypothetical protein n=1 Tax=Streptomyces xanthophaeus TaxID=67385 RepID=UPI00233F503A|nr:hypothetical protein [Streptomyces xanthophaeus]WCD87909.1 hypothetical protein KPP03845_104310 [Streptomyces xanthophaeus]
MHPTRLPRAALALLTLAAFATGCGLVGGGSRGKGAETMTMQQGATRADGILQETLAAVKPELHWNHGPSSDAGCTKGVAGAATGTGSAKRKIIILTVVSEQRRGALLGVIERDWKGRGYTITNVRASKDVPAIYAETPDGYILTAKVGGEGQFFLEAATPCLADHPVQDPTTKPNTPTRNGPYPPRPDVQDEFWSATTPLPSGSPTP